MTFKLKLNKPTIVAVGSLFVFALLIRLWGVWHGLPYIYSVDEPALVHSVLGLRFDLNPHHFDWPHFHFYLSFLAFGLFYKARIAWQVWGWKPAMEAAFPILWNDGAIFYLLLRLLSVLMGALTVIPVFLASREILGTKKRALLATFIFAVTPFLVENSKYALIDVPATFWAAWSLFFAVRAFKYPSLKTYLAAGFLGGLAASTKYNAVLILLVLVLIHLARLPLRTIAWSIKNHRFSKKLVSLAALDWWKLVLAGFTSIIAFFLGTPYALLDWKDFVRSDTSTGALWQLTRGGTRFELAVFGRLFNSLFSTIPTGFGYAALFVSLIGLVVALRSTSKLQKAVSIFTILFYLYVGSSAFAPEQIFMPLYLTLVPLFTLGTAAMINFIHREFFESNRSWQQAFYLCLLLFILPSTAASLKIDYLYTSPDTRNIAKDYIDAEIPAGKVIGIDGEYQPYFEGTHPVVGVPAWRWQPLSQDKIEYVVVSGESSLDAVKDNPKYGGLLDGKYPVYMVQNFGDRMGPNLFIYKLNYPLANQWWLDDKKLPTLSVEEILNSDHEWRESVLPASFTTSLVVTGSWDLTGTVGETMKAKDDFGYPTDKIGNHLKNFDLATANLVTPFVTDCHDFSVCASDNAVKAMINSGIKVASLPDLGAYSETKDILTKNKIGYSSGSIISYQVANNIKFAFLNFYQAQNVQSLLDVITAAKGEKAQVIVASFDVGLSSLSEDIAHLAIDSGVDVVIGNSTTIQKIEVYKNKIIAYGLGPFINGVNTWTADDSFSQLGLLGQFYFFNDRLVDAEFKFVDPASYNILTGFDPRAGFADENNKAYFQDLVDTLAKRSR